MRKRAIRSRAAASASDCVLPASAGRTEVCFFVKPYASTRVACYNGLIVQAAINNLLPLFYVILQRDFNVSVERLGMLTAVNFITQLIVDLFAAVFVDRLGWRRCICLSHIFAVGGFVMLSFLPGVIDRIRRSFCR